MDNIKIKEFEFFRDTASHGHTVMTVAVAEALMKARTDDYIDAMKKYGRLYPDAGYGGHFGNWLFSDDKEPYNSWGNGSAMRVSPVAWFYSTLYDVEENAAVCAEVTHNHNQGVRGAQATATAIFLARTGKTKGEIKRYIEEIYKYDLSVRHS
jgi:ADP-ribosylglycohydrolase